MSPPVCYTNCRFGFCFVFCALCVLRMRSKKKSKKLFQTCGNRADGRKANWVNFFSRVNDKKYTKTAPLKKSPIYISLQLILFLEQIADSGGDAGNRKNWNKKIFFQKSAQNHFFTVLSNFSFFHQKIFFRQGRI